MHNHALLSSIIVLRVAERCVIFSRVNCVPEHTVTQFSQAVLTGGMAPPASTRISARLKCVQEHSSPVNLAPQARRGRADDDRHRRQAPRLAARIADARDAVRPWGGWRSVHGVPLAWPVVEQRGGASSCFNTFYL